MEGEKEPHETTMYIDITGKIESVRWIFFFCPGSFKENGKFIEFI